MAVRSSPVRAESPSGNAGAQTLSQPAPRRRRLLAGALLPGALLALACGAAPSARAEAAASPRSEQARSAAVQPERGRCRARATGVEDATVRSAESYALALDQAWEASGVLLVERDGEILLERAIGLSSRESGAAMTPQTQFAIGSVTKAWTAWLVRDAARSGVLPLGSTLGRWFPALSQWRDITIQQLLEHRSGLIRTVPGVHESASPAEATERCAQAPLLFPPGTAEAYSNCGYDVLARVLELAHHSSFPELLRQRLLEPHGMLDSGLGSGPRLAQGYAREEGKTVPAKKSPASGGSGGGYSTARDLCQFLLARREQEREVQPAAPAGPAPAASSVHAQAGKTEGFLSFLVTDRKTRTSIVYLTNQEGAPVARVVEDLKKLVLGQAVEAPRSELRRVLAGDSRLEEWLLGTFQLDVDPSQRMRIERRGRQLVFIDPGGHVSALVWVGPRALLPVALDDQRSEVSSDAEITFPELAGPASQIELHVAGGMTLKATRISS